MLIQTGQAQPQLRTLVHREASNSLTCSDRRPVFVGSFTRCGGGCVGWDQSVQKCTEPPLKMLKARGWFWALVSCWLQFCIRRDVGRRARINMLMKLVHSFFFHI